MHSSAHDTVDLEIMWRPSELVRGKFAENLQLETSIHIASMADFSARARQAWEDQVGAAGGERHLRAAEVDCSAAACCPPPLLAGGACSATDGEEGATLLRCRPACGGDHALVRLQPVADGPPYQRRAIDI